MQVSDIPIEREQEEDDNEVTELLQLRRTSVIGIYDDKPQTPATKLSLLKPQGQGIVNLPRVPESSDDTGMPKAWSSAQ